MGILMIFSMLALGFVLWLAHAADSAADPEALKKQVRRAHELEGGVALLEELRKKQKITRANLGRFTEDLDNLELRAIVAGNGKGDAPANGPTNKQP